MLKKPVLILVPVSVNFPVLRLKTTLKTMDVTRSRTQSDLDPGFDVPFIRAIVLLYAFVGCMTGSGKSNELSFLTRLNIQKCYFSLCPLLDYTLTVSLYYTVDDVILKLLFPFYLPADLISYLNFLFYSTFSIAPWITITRLLFFSNLSFRHLCLKLDQPKSACISVQSKSRLLYTTPPLPLHKWIPFQIRTPWSALMPLYFKSTCVFQFLPIWTTQFCYLPRHVVKTLRTDSFCLFNSKKPFVWLHPKVWPSKVRKRDLNLQSWPDLWIRSPSVLDLEIESAFTVELLDGR